MLGWPPKVFLGGAGHDGSSWPVLPCCAATGGFRPTVDLCFGSENSTNNIWYHPHLYRARRCTLAACSGSAKEEALLGPCCRALAGADESSETALQDAEF